MEGQLVKMGEIGSTGILTVAVRSERAKLTEWVASGGLLFEWLAEKNGFYAFESALHIFPIGKKEGVMDLETWNSTDVWREAYGDLANGYLFFGEDILGNQFCLNQDGIDSLDAETGQVTHLADRLVIKEYEFHTGYLLAHGWQLANRPLNPGERLVPKTLFVTGGGFPKQNLYAVDSRKGMRVPGHLSPPIKDPPHRARGPVSILP